MDIDRIHKQITLQLSRLRIRDANDVDDLKQAIVCEILLQRDHHDRSRSTFETFCDGIIRKHLNNFRSRKRWLKHQAHESIHDLEEEDEPLTNDVRSGELDFAQQRVFASELQEAIDRMPDRLRECCEWLKKFSPEETAEKLGVSPATVHRMVVQIRDLLTGAGFASQA